jgi:adenosylhomocysteine nucleosidase
VRIGGGSRSGAQDAVEWLAAHAVRAVISFGLAAGLDPALAPGALLVPRVVIAGGRRLACDPALTSALGGTTMDSIYDAWRVISSVADKQQIRRESGADALDMESGAVALVCARLGIPFAVLRAVCDPADRALPPIALAALDQGGEIGILRVAGAALLRPWQVPGLLALGRDAAAARNSLRATVARVGPLG